VYSLFLILITNIVCKR